MNWYQMMLSIPIVVLAVMRNFEKYSNVARLGLCFSSYHKEILGVWGLLSETSTTKNSMQKGGCDGISFHHLTSVNNEGNE